ncbi:MAG TPA: prepilin-type N-terminal cleavage/methylation domain-containing protein [Candidatus Baltobacteraceae bacterium]|nr:prepilin-type N-terminal cleavage/methylation domain-containing protein [Candidatus Baltobacteraceae bacterium]
MRVPQRGRKGFTLIELLVVIAIIGLLSTLAVVALNSARQRSRDAKRVSDIRQIQTALELGYAEIGGYPSAPSPIVLGSASTDVMCVNGGSVFQGDTTGCTTTLMGLVPSNPTPNGADYLYSSATGSATYRITFSLEGATGQLGAGANCANQNGIAAGSSC